MTNHAFRILAVLSFVSSNSFAGTLATVNGRAITDEDLNALVSNLPVQQRGVVLKDPNARKQLIDNLVDQELMVQDATSKKMDATKEYKDGLNSFRRQSLVNILVQKQLAPKITDAAVKDYFNKHKMQYSGDQVRAMHILVPTEAEAQAILAEVKKPGADFQKIAETKSKDPSAKNNRGDLGFFSREMYDPSFTEAAFTAKKGDIVGPVKSAFGFHVIKVADRKLGKAPEFAEVEQKVKTDLQHEVLGEYVKSLKQKAKIKE